MCGRCRTEEEVDVDMELETGGAGPVEARWVVERDEMSLDMVEA